MDTGSVQDIKAVATQGRGDTPDYQWVKSYKVFSSSLLPSSLDLSEKNIYEP